MALIKTCDHCGAKISLRKMPHGRFVAFEFQTQTPHKCGSGRKSKKRTRRKSPQPVLLEPHHVDSAPKTVQHETTPVSGQSKKSFSQDGNAVKVLETIKNRPGLKAREIAEQLGFDRNQVNAILFGSLNELVEQDSHFGWRVKQGQPLGVPEQAPSQRFKADQGDEINWLKWIGYAVGVFILYKILTG